MHPAHLIDYLVIPRIMQVLPFGILLLIGFRKAAFIAATAATAELLQVMVVVGIFVRVSHSCARKAENETT